ncbi:hypothetical protein [Streptomyces albicerus]|uniref:hypothetical protein n=1 Tax=Streptomyces albicerus TaxID=2569859 RepID=UPI00124B3DC6|nr:hypothetical protein [Streptomyces albicerus]
MDGESVLAGGFINPVVPVVPVVRVGQMARRPPSARSGFARGRSAQGDSAMVGLRDRGVVGEVRRAHR